MKRIKTFIAILFVTCCLSLVSCDTKEMKNVDFSGMHFKCIEDKIDGSLLLMHEETGVLYVHILDGISPILKEDGTAYTIEDYEKNLKWKGDINEKLYSK